MRQRSGKRAGPRRGAHAALAAALALAALAAAPVADARRLAVVDDRAEGVALAGGDVLTGVTVRLRSTREDGYLVERHEYRLLAFGNDGRARALLARRFEDVSSPEGTGTGTSFAFRASDSHLALVRRTSEVSENGGDESEQLEAGPLAGPLVRHSRCSTEGEANDPAFDVGGPDLAFTDLCSAYRAVHVATPAGSAPRQLVVGAENTPDAIVGPVAIGGDLLIAAVHVPAGPSAHRLLDVGTGAVRGDLPVAQGREIAAFDVAADGSAVWLERPAGSVCGGDLRVLPPGAPAGQGELRASGVCALLATGGGRALVVDGEADSAALRAVALAGPADAIALADGLRAHRDALERQLGGQLAIDATRIALVRAPCGGPASVEDVALGSEALTVVRDCTLRVRRSRVRAGRRGRVRVPVACANGCGGFARLTDRRGTRARGSVSGAPGATGRATLTLTRSARRALAARGRLRLRLEVPIRPPLGGRTTLVRRTVTVLR